MGFPMKQVHDRDGITLFQGPFQTSGFRPGQFDVLLLDPPSNITDSRIMHALFVKGRMIDSLKIPQIIYIFEGGSRHGSHVLQRERPQRSDARVVCTTDGFEFPSEDHGRGHTPAESESGTGASPLW